MLKNILYFWESLIYPWLSAHGIKIGFILAGILVMDYFAHRLVSKLIKQYTNYSYKSRDGQAREKRQNTLEGVFISTLHIIIWLVGVFMILSETGVDTTPLLAGVGVAGIAFGFGGQYLIRDIIAGFFIIMEDQYRNGDVVNIAGIGGLVEDINLRRTVLRDLDGIEHHIPNGEIKTTSNMTKFWSRAHINIGVAYKEKIDTVIEVLNRLGKEMAEDPKWKNDIIKPIQVLGVDDFADSAVVVKVLGDTKPIRQWDVMREFRRRVKNEFDKLGIEIPYPHRVVINEK